VSHFPDLKKEWKKVASSNPDKTSVIELLDKTRHRFRSQFTITKYGLRKTGYRDLSMVDKEEEAKVPSPKITNNSCKIASKSLRLSPNSAMLRKR
jgi:hypothetical protein